MQLFMPMVCGVSALVLASAGCGGSGVPAGTAGNPIVARFTHVAADFTPKGRVTRRFAELVSERSNGRIEVRVYPSGQLFGDKE